MLLSIGMAAAIAQAQAPVAAPAAPAAGQAATAAAPDAQPLKALFIEVNGKVQWRSGADQPWQNAKVDDVVTSGAEVRTGLKSFAALRVGDNATALIDAGTMFQMPAMVRDGDTLRTTVSVKSGRADFKVDKVGLTNDFKVVTPSTTLAVRGTEFAVASGALKQVEVLGARTNTINAIELKYALNNMVVRMSGAAASNAAIKQPTHNAIVATASPATAGALPSTNSTEAVANAAVGPSPANAGSPAEAQQSNNASAKSQTAVSRERDSDGDGNSLADRIARMIKDANTRADKALARLMAIEDLAGFEIQALRTSGVAKPPGEFQGPSSRSIVKQLEDMQDALVDLASAQKDALAALERNRQVVEGVPLGSPPLGGTRNGIVDDGKGAEDKFRRVFHSESGPQSIESRFTVDHDSISRELTSFERSEDAATSALDAVDAVASSEAAALDSGYVRRASAAGASPWDADTDGVAGADLTQRLSAIRSLVADTEGGAGLAGRYAAAVQLRDRMSAIRTELVAIRDHLDAHEVRLATQALVLLTSALDRMDLAIQEADPDLAPGPLNADVGSALYAARRALNGGTIIVNDEPRQIKGIIELVAEIEGEDIAGSNPTGLVRTLVDAAVKALEHPEDPDPQGWVDASDLLVQVEGKAAELTQEHAMFIDPETGLPRDQRSQLVLRVMQVVTAVQGLIDGTVDPAWDKLVRDRVGAMPGGRFTSANEAMGSVMARSQDSFEALAGVGADRAEAALHAAKGEVGMLNGVSFLARQQVDAAKARVIEADGLGPKRLEALVSSAGSRGMDAQSAAYGFGVAFGSIPDGNSSSEQTVSGALAGLVDKTQQRVYYKIDFEGVDATGNSLQGTASARPLVQVQDSLGSMPVNPELPHLGGNVPVVPVGPGESGSVGFVWTGNAWVFSSSDLSAQSDRSLRNGYYNGTSGGQGLANHASGPFFMARSGDERWTLESATFTGAWHSDIRVVITDHSDDAGPKPQQVTIHLGSPVGPSERSIGMGDLSEVKFSVSGSQVFGFPETPTTLNPQGGPTQTVVIDNLVWSRLEPVSAVVYLANDAVDEHVAPGQRAVGAVIDGAKNLLWVAPAAGPSSPGGMFGSILTMDQRLADLRALDSMANWQERAGEALETAKSSFADALEEALLAADAASKSEDRVTQDHAEAVRIHAVTSLLAKDIDSEDSIVTAFEKLVDAGGPLEDFNFDGDAVRGYHARVVEAREGIEQALGAASETRVLGGNIVIGATQGTVSAQLPQGGQLVQGQATVAARLQAFDDLRAGVDTALARVGNSVAPGVISAATEQLRVGLERFQSDAELATGAFADYARSAEKAAAAGLPAVAETSGIASAVTNPVGTLQALRQASLDASETKRRMDVLLVGSEGRTVVVNDDQRQGVEVAVLQRVDELRAEVQALQESQLESGDRWEAAKRLLDGLDGVHEVLVGRLASGGTQEGAAPASVASVRADASLAAIAGRRSSVDTLAGDGASIVTQVEARRDEIEEESDAAVKVVEKAAAAASHAAKAAADLASAAREFETRFAGSGLAFESADVESNATRAASAAADAARHVVAANAAEKSMRDLFDGMPSQGGWSAWVSSVAASARQSLGAADSALAGNEEDAQALDDQLRGLSVVNALAARTFADAGARSSAYLQQTIEAQANGERPWSGGELDAVARLRVFEAKVSAADSALLSADASVLRAKQAADSAVLLSAVAVARRDDAERGWQAGDSIFTFASARLSRTAADLTAVRTNEAHREVGVTDALVRGSAVTEISALGDEGVEAQFALLEGKMVNADASVNGDRSERRASGVVNDTRPEYAADSIRGQIEFFDNVVNVLSGRVDPSLVLAGEQVGGQPVTHGDLVRGAATQMDAVRAMAQNAARELAGQADQAMQMAERGRSNAHRFFGKSLHCYVSKAQADHTRAYEAWKVANVAAGEAKGFADEFGSGHGIAVTGITPVAPLQQPTGSQLASGGN